MYKNMTPAEYNKMYQHRRIHINCTGCNKQYRRQDYNICPYCGHLRKTPIFDKKEHLKQQITHALETNQ